MAIRLKTNDDKAKFLLEWIAEEVNKQTRPDTVTCIDNSPKDKVIMLCVQYLDKETGCIEVDIPSDYSLVTIGSTFVNRLKENMGYLRYLTNTCAMVDNKCPKEDLYINVMLPNTKIFQQHGIQLVKELGLAMLKLLKPTIEIDDFVIEEYNPAQELFAESFEEVKEENVDDVVDDLMSDFDDIMPPVEEMRNLIPEEEKAVTAGLESISEPTGKTLFEEKKLQPKSDKKKPVQHQQKSVFGATNNNKKNGKNKNK